jgi:hypothetical protein
MKYFVKIKRDLPGKPGGALRFGPIPTLAEARTIAAHESREPKTHWVKVVNEKNEVKYSLAGGDAYKPNPAKRKGTAKPYRRSQATKKAPTKRLVSRRKSNTEKGYFPNPINPPVKESDVSKLMASMYNAAEAAKKKSPAASLQARVSFAQGLMVAANVLGVFPRGEMQSLMNSIRAAIK